MFCFNFSLKRTRGNIGYNIIRRGLLGFLPRVMLLDLNTGHPVQHTLGDAIRVLRIYVFGYDAENCYRQSVYTRSIGIFSRSLIALASLCISCIYR